MSDLRTLLLTDVVDSTQLSQRLGDAAMAEVWAAHDRVARDLLREAGGREIDKTDGMLLMFEHAADAANYALAYHRALAALPVPLAARAGLHVGPVILRENSAADVAMGAKPLEVDGLAKPTAARVMSLARGGQLLLTEEARDALGRTKLRVRSHGHFAVKGVAEPLELFEARDDDAAFQSPPDSEKVWRVVQSGERWLPVSEIPNNLPQQVTSFIGRERELGEVKELLAQHRLLTLLGMGGLGKTRLSLQVATELMHRFPDGAWFLDLAPIRDPALVVGEAAQVLGVREEPERPLIQTLGAAVRGKRLLLVVDNCEHLVQASAQLVNALLRAAPGVSIVTSSREALRVPGEQTYPVLPLPLPGRGDGLEALARSTAVRLFVERAQLHKPAFALNEREAPAVAELVARLEGIPLALELAAARVRSLTVSDINARLKDRYKLLTGGGRVLLERQQTLRALVDWSYELLTPPEQTAFTRLSVFAGGFELTAAEAVCGVDPLEPDDLLDLLASLAEKSILMLDDSGETARYRMLETLRDYGREKLEQAGDGAATAVRHCEHFFALAKQANRALAGPEAAAWVRRSEDELDNLRAGMALALTGAVDPFVAVKYAVAMQGFWILRGYASEGRAYVRSTLALPAIQASDIAQAWALYVGAALAGTQSDHAEARQMLEVCLTLRRRLGNPIDIAATLSTLSLARLQAGDATGALDGEEEALQLFRQAEDRSGQAIGLLHLGQIGVYLSEDEQARAWFGQGLAIAQAIGHHEVEAECERGLAELAFEQRDWPLAQRHIERSLARCRETGDKRGEVASLGWLGRLDLARGDLAAAGPRLAEALQAFKTYEMRAEWLAGLEDLAACALAEGRPEAAVPPAAMAAASRAQLGLVMTPRAEARWQQHLAALRLALPDGRFEALWDAARAGPQAS
jgi:predicted ATPase/class 3 adenylate cyclase